jgi:cholinesterase
LSGTSFLEREDSTANVVLYDQRFALEWVQKYISLFGGSPNRVTVIGESAGGGSIEHQITAYAGQGEAPFQQAILQSPGFKPKPDFTEQEAIFQKTLSYASLIAGKKIATVQDLAALSRPSRSFSLRIIYLWGQQSMEISYSDLLSTEI